MKYRMYGRNGITDREFQKLVDWDLIPLKKCIKEDGELMYKIDTDGVDKLDMGHIKLKGMGIRDKYGLYVDNSE